MKLAIAGMQQGIGLFVVKQHIQRNTSSLYKQLPQKFMIRSVFRGEHSVHMSMMLRRIMVVALFHQLLVWAIPQQVVYALVKG